MNISIVIPNYNGEGLLRQNLPRLIGEISRYKKGEVEIIVVDDSSKDSSLEVLSNFEVKVVRNEKNLGFSSTVNKGVKAAKGAIKSKFSDFQIKTIAYKNQFIFVWHNATDIKLRIAHFLFLPYHFIKAFKKWDIPFFLGFFKALILLPKIIESSFRVQKLFIKNDFEVIKDFKE